MDGAAVAGHFFQKSYRLVERDAVAISDIKDFPSHFVCGRGTRQQVGINRIVHVGKIAALLTIAENCGLFSAQHLHDEACQDT